MAKKKKKKKRWNTRLIFQNKFLSHHEPTTLTSNTHCVCVHRELFTYVHICIGMMYAHMHKRVVCMHRKYLYAFLEIVSGINPNTSYCLFTISTSLTTCNRFIARLTRDYGFIDWWWWQCWFSLYWCACASVCVCMLSRATIQFELHSLDFHSVFSLAFRFFNAWIIIYLLHNCSYKTIITITAIRFLMHVFGRVVVFVAFLCLYQFIFRLSALYLCVLSGIAVDVNECLNDWIRC